MPKKVMRSGYQNTVTTYKYKEDDEMDSDQADQYDQAEEFFSLLHILTKQQDLLDCFRIIFTQKLMKARQKAANLTACTCPMDDKDFKAGKLSESNWEIYLSEVVLSSPRFGREVFFTKI